MDEPASTESDRATALAEPAPAPVANAGLAVGPSATATPPVKRFSRLRKVWGGVRQVVREALAVVRGRPADDKAAATPGTSTATEDAAAAGAASPDKSEKPSWRVAVLHSITEQLRGAADSYVAAKLDEIEARVDQKLDAIENRIDRKIVELHTHLAEMRDRELRHRLRLLKITLIFSALVAALSLLYNWIKVRWL